MIQIKVSEQSGTFLLSNPYKSRVLVVSKLKYSDRLNSARALIFRKTTEERREFGKYVVIDPIT